MRWISDHFPITSNDNIIVSLSLEAYLQEWYKIPPLPSLPLIQTVYNMQVAHLIKIRYTQYANWCLDNVYSFVSFVVVHFCCIGKFEVVVGEKRGEGHTRESHSLCLGTEGRDPSEGIRTPNLFALLEQTSYHKTYMNHYKVVKKVFITELFQLSFLTKLINLFLQ